MWGTLHMQVAAVSLLESANVPLQSAIDVLSRHMPGWYLYVAMYVVITAWAVPCGGASY